MRQLKKLFRNHSPYLVFITICEIIISTIATLSFVYTDRLNYAEANILQGLGIEKLLESIYSSTWWALILLLLALIAILSLVTIVYKKLDYLFIGICLWVVMLILGINLNNSILDNLSIILIAIPIFLLNIIAYNTEKTIINKRKKEKKEENFTKVDIVGYTLMVLVIISISLYLVNVFIQDNKKKIQIENTTTESITTTTTEPITTTIKNSKKNKTLN